MSLVANQPENINYLIILRRGIGPVVAWNLLWRENNSGKLYYLMAAVGPREEG
ncbi:MAG: hypothetical protein U9N73_05460 [Candidatus Auribacterota bacterium]|nr:hypothetical protein [Candidatus Auribacterota bacterium]